MTPSGSNASREGHARLTFDPTRYVPCFVYRKGQLCCERVPLALIAARVGTPAYVYSRASLATAYRRFHRAFRAVPHIICYAVKANSNLSLLRLLARLGSSFDIVSGGELDRLRRIGVAGERIVYSGVGKSREEIREALRAGILLLNVESEAELELLAAEAARIGRPAPAALRINPDVEAGGHPHISTGHHRHKFGIDWNDGRRLYLSWQSSRWIAWRGISAHIGSQILSVTPFRRAVTRMAGFVRELARAGVKILFLDLGGGLGVRYTSERPPQVADYAPVLTRAVRHLGCRLLLEPGRALVAHAGILLMRVLYTKRSQGKPFVVVDAGMNDFMRPALYQAVHPITPAIRSGAAREVERADIVGPVCETGDCFLHDWPMEQVNAGDLLVLWGAGAYGFVEASTYNSRPRPAEVLVEGNSFRTIRRRESRADLIRGE
jgi:diaminopimelate decarboxylase